MITLGRGSISFQQSSPCCNRLKKPQSAHDVIRLSEDAGLMVSGRVLES